MSLENIKIEFGKQIDRLITQSTPRKTSDALNNIKVQLIRELENYADACRKALDDYINDPQIELHNKQSEIEALGQKIEARKKILIEAKQVGSLTVTTIFGASLHSVLELRDKLTSKGLFIDKFELKFDKFKVPPFTVPEYANIPQNVQVSINTYYSNAAATIAKQISECDKSEYFCFAVDFKNSIKKQYEAVVVAVDAHISQMQAFVTKERKDYEAENNVYERFKIEFNRISAKVRGLIQRINAANEAETINIIKEITELCPSIYSFHLPTHFKYCQDEIDEIAEPINKLKAFHLAYSKKQTAELKRLTQGVTAKVDNIKQRIKTFSAIKMKDRSKKLTDIIAEIEQGICDIDAIKIPDYLYSTKLQQRAKRNQHNLKSMRADLEQRKYNLNIILQMHKDVEPVSAQFLVSEANTYQLFATKKTLAELRALSFDHYRKHDYAAFDSVEKKLKATRGPSFELEGDLFEETKTALLGYVTKDKMHCIAYAENHETDRDTLILNQIKDSLLADVNLVALLKHAEKIAKDGEKGRNKSESIKLLESKIKSATSLYELDDIISGKSRSAAYQLSLITSSRSFFGFGKVTSSTYLTAFQHSAKRLILEGKLVRPAPASP